MKAPIMILTVLATATAWGAVATWHGTAAPPTQPALGVAAPEGAPDTQPQAQDSAALIARGDSVYHGTLGGAICATCHGKDAKGVAGMGPDLTDKVWLHGDGGVKFIETIVRTGVSKPKKSSVAMPPFGGVPLDSAKTVAVAAYIHSLGAPQK